MKVCIFGAGAIGGHIATRLINAGADEISLIARGNMLKVIRERGLTLRSNGKEELHARPQIVTDDPSSLPPQDLVVVAVKAPALTAAAPAIGRLIGPGGAAVFLINGIPWWYQHGRKGAHGTLALLDPDGALWREVRPERALGCVVQSPNDMVEPGVIVHSGGNQLVIGEPDNSTTPRVQAAVAMFKRGGVDSRVSTDIRRDIWGKLCLNASGNTVSAITRNDLAQLGADEDLCRISVNIMKETLAVAAAQGWDLRAETDCEAAARRGRPGQRTSMMQDALAFRAMECEALLGQTQAFARELGIATPTIDVVLPLLRGLDRAFRVK